MACNSANTGYIGVTKRGTKWITQIHIQYWNYIVGIFTDKKDAARAYDKIAKEWYGQDAATNF